ncbi:hypothetical protein BFJ72_g14991 [Fusarium proliferatum]|uniref:Antigenic cell wall galactomannoprotein n=1 Tax=Gibberella intermedia TaxID=948311 RepID=A0A420RV25_GIBIN|nr:hypothetical protein BFJ72_g14991 [Fusarium proliferatum]
MRFSGFFSILAAGLALAAPSPSHSQRDLELRAADANTTDLAGALGATKGFRTSLNKDLAQISSTRTEGPPDVAAKIIAGAIGKIAAQAQSEIVPIMPLVLSLHFPLNQNDTVTLVALAQEVQGIIVDSRNTAVELLRGLTPDVIQALITAFAVPFARNAKSFLGPSGVFVDALIPSIGPISRGLGVFAQLLANALGGSA